MTMPRIHPRQELVEAARRDIPYRLWDAFARHPQASYVDLSVALSAITMEMIRVNMGEAGVAHLTSPVQIALLVDLDQALTEAKTAHPGLAVEELWLLLAEFQLDVARKNLRRARGQ